MRFRLIPKSSTLDDLELLQIQIFTEFCVRSHFGEATAAMLGDPKWGPIWWVASYSL